MNMTPTQLKLLHDWVEAMISAAIADNEEDSEGYRGTGYLDRKVADELFDRFKDSIQDTPWDGSTLFIRDDLEGNP